MSVMRLIVVVLTVVLSVSMSAAKDSDDRTIVVSGEAEIKVTPDEVILVLGVASNDMDINIAKQENDKIVAAVLKAVSEFEIPDRHIQTDYLNIEPRWDIWSGGEKFLGYFVRKTVVITLLDVSGFDDLLTAVLAAGATNVHDVQFRTTELRKYRDQARALAIKAAEEKANDLAIELACKVGEPQSIREGWVGWRSWYNMWGRSGGRGGMSQNVIQTAGDGAAVDGSVALGQISVSARITVTFELE